MRQRVAIGLLLAVALATTGCAQVLTDGPITFEADPASVDDATLQEHGYQLEDSDTARVNDTVDVPGVGERRVEITNHVRAYARTDGDGGGALMVVSTPQAQVAGQGTNPLGRVPLKELIERVASEAADDQELEQVGTTEVTVLGTQTTVEKYAMEDGSGELQGYVHVTRVAHGDDYVVAVGLVPAEYEDEEDAIYALMEGIEHDG